MTRSYGDPVQVSGPDGAGPGGSGGSGGPGGSGGAGSPVPDCFRWRGRRYVVRLVLAHWIEVGPWWRAASALDLESAEAAAASGTAGEAAASRAEREVWRVEATPDPAVSPGVYDLARDGTGGWRLVRTID